MRALFSGVTGIRSHQVRMDVIGNNIANVNTTGFKGSRVTFQDVFSQTMSAGSASTAPQQVGLGGGIASTDLTHTAGSLQLTGRDLDLAIEGNGFFSLKGLDGSNLYTRAGNFDWDSEGHLVSPSTGARVQGWTADLNGTIGNTSTGSLGPIRVIKGDIALAQKSTKATFGGNLDANGTSYDTAFTAYDSLGRAQSITITFTKTGTNTWSWTTTGATGSGSLGFNTNGSLNSGGTANITLSPAGAEAQTISLDMSRLTQAYAGASGSSAIVRSVDGFPMGTLDSVAVDGAGTVIGTYDNGFRRVLAQIAIANFPNQGGLLKVGNSGFTESTASGKPLVGQPNSGGRGRIVPGNLEMSNVDLSIEFTSMILTQRGFQANARVISAADEMIQDLVNLRR